ncbi:MAG TPA: Gfo/Idh/MocA family oxidoreductase [Verrucomicrobiae bacterium]|jgi:predicted dehydrogenase
MRASRRQFLKTSAVAATGTVAWGGLQTSASARRILGANDRLNIACVGTANRAAADIAGVKGENIVALCDVDETYLGLKANEFPGAKTYRDFRRMLEQKDIDAVVVGTPDHTHAIVAAAALDGGRHVYCEKPLTRTVSETRRLRELAKRKGLATQMGNQIHAGANYRRVVEVVQSGAIGPVKEVHVWSGSTYGHIEYPKEFPPMPPANLDWDLWHGPMAVKPYHPDFVPAKWRNWWHYGGGSLADFGCHYIDLPHWALDLRVPLTIEAIKGPKPDKERPPTELAVKYEYPTRDAKPPVTLFWYQGGGHAPQLPEKFEKEFRAGVLFVGEKGMLLSGYTKYHLLPEERFTGFVAPKPWIADSAGHHEEWIRACKTGSPTLSNFDYAGALTEVVLLGNVAHRAGCKLEWDAANLRAKNCRAADEFLQHHYREGWKLT